jgi:type VI protein secretion system component VasK
MPRSSVVLGGLAILTLLFAAYACIGVMMTADFFAGSDRPEYARAAVIWASVAVASFLISIGLGIAAWRRRRRDGTASAPPSES